MGNPDHDRFFEALANADDKTLQAAADAVNEFTRTKMREASFYRRIMPPDRFPAMTMISTPKTQDNVFYGLLKDSTPAQLKKTLNYIEWLLAARKRRILRLDQLHCTVQPNVPRPKRRILKV